MNCAQTSGTVAVLLSFLPKVSVAYSVSAGDQYQRLQRASLREGVSIHALAIGITVCYEVGPLVITMSL